jgi:lysophospholipase L1-like esterase
VAPDQPEQFDFWDRVSYLTLQYGSPKRGREQNAPRTVPHPYLGYALAASWRTPPGPGNQASHNALGFRGPETTWEKPPGVFRIVTTGGSSVYGMSESKDEAVWSRVLEEQLNASGLKQRVEVINLGVFGWTSTEMLINLGIRGLDLQPDLVIVYEAINDKRAALYTLGGEVQHDNTHWRAVWPVDRPSKLESMLEKSRTYMIWRRYWTPYAIERVDLGFFAMVNYKHYLDNRETVRLYLHAPEPPPDLGFEIYRRNLEQMVAITRARGAQILFATQALPRWHLAGAVDEADQLAGLDRILKIQRDVATAMNVPVCDSAAVVGAQMEAEVQSRIAAEVAADPTRPREEIEADLRRAGRSDLLFSREVHPNDAGSALIARTIADCLLASQLLPR